MKKILCFLLFLALSFGTGAVVGYHYEHAKNQSDIAEIELVAKNRVHCA